MSGGLISSIQAPRTFTDYDIKTKSVESKSVIVNSSGSGNTDLVGRAIDEHRDDNFWKSAFAISRTHRQLSKLHELLLKLKSLEVENKYTILPFLNQKKREVEDKIKMIEEGIKRLKSESGEAYTMYNLIKLRNYHVNITTGKLVETPTVEYYREQIVDTMLTGKPIFIKGPPGTGKTELAKHCAALIAKQKVEERYKKLIQATSHNKYDNDEDEKLKLEERTRLKNQEVTDIRDAAATSYYIVSGSKDFHHSELAGTGGVRAAESGDGAIETYFNYGPLYKAVEEGKPLIIDEANLIPPSILLKLNEFMTRTPGEIITVQENGGKQIKIAKGFSIIYTGNVGAQFAGREKLEASQKSRMGLVIDYDYLPNADGISDSIKDCAAKSEGWHVLLSYFVDSKARMMLPESDMNQLWQMSKAISYAQNVYAGKSDKEIKIPNASGGESILVAKEVIKDDQFDFRAINTIIDEYKKDMSMPLGCYIVTKFIKEKCSSPESVELYFNIFKDYGLIDDGYKALLTEKSAEGLKEIKDNIRRKNVTQKVYSSREVVELAFGPAPELSESELDKIEKKYLAYVSELDPNEAQRLYAAKLEREQEEALQTARDEVQNELDEMLAQMSFKNNINNPTSFDFPHLLQSLKISNHLDSTFENKDYHTIEMKTQTHVEAISRYEKSGGKTWIWPNLKTEMPYNTQQPSELKVLSIQFRDPLPANWTRSSDNIVEWMKQNDLRPLTYEELLEYITTHPEHQKQNWLISLGTKHVLGGVLRVPNANFDGVERDLGAGSWSADWDADNRFLAVPISA